MKIIYTTIFCAFLFFPILGASEIHAGAVNTRNAVINSELDIIQSHAGYCDELNWNDVCMFDETPENLDKNKKSSVSYHDLKKSEAVDKALNKFDVDVTRSHAMAKAPKEEENQQSVVGYVKDFFTPRDGDFSFFDVFEDDNKVLRASSEHQFSVASQVFKSKYEEPDVMRQRGTMYGVEGKYTFRPSNENPFHFSFVNTYRVDAMYAKGKFDYEALDSSQTGLRIDKDDYMSDIRYMLGNEFSRGENDSFTVFTGYGQRYLNDDTEEGATMLGLSLITFYERESRYYYVPLGIEYIKKLKDNWELTANFEYDYLVMGRQTSHLSDANQFTPQPSDDVDNKQDHGYGMRGSLALAKGFGPVDLMFEPFFRYWNMETSEVAQGRFNGTVFNFVEPHNKTFELGAKLGVAF